MSSLRLASTLALLLVLVTFACGQTNLIVNGGFESGDFTGWLTPQGVNDTINGNFAANRLRAFTYGTASSSPNGWAYDGSYSALWESSTLNQSIVQTVAVTGGTQYLLSFYVEFTDGDTTSYLQVSAQFNDGTSVVLLTPNGAGAQQSYCSGSAASQPPFWWSQFKFTVTAPSAATAMNLTFYGYDSEYGFLVDAITMYPAAGNSQPAAPPATPVVPAGNLLLNGNFETGSVAPWRETNGDNPYGLSGNTYSGEGSYDFNGYAGHSGIPCPEGNYCFTFGAPEFTLPIQQTLAIPSGTSSSFTLSFYWYSPGGYNASLPADRGSALIAAAGWGSATPTVLFSEYNTTAVTTATSYNTVTLNLGVPPSGTTSLTLQLAGYFYQTYYVVDYVQLTASGLTQSQTPVVYSCPSVSNPSTPSNGAAPAVSTGAVSALALLSTVAMVLLML